MNGLGKSPPPRTMVLVAVVIGALVVAFVWLRSDLPTRVTNLLPAAAGPATSSGGDAISVGRKIFQQKGCGACHSTDGSRNVGPTLKGLYGSTVELNDGSTATADDAFLEESIRAPRARVAKGFPALMPKTELTEEQMRELVAYLKSLS